MKKSVIILIVVLSILALGGIAYGITDFVLAKKRAEEEQLFEEEKQRDEAAILGIWSAVIEEEYKSQYSYKPDKITIIYYLWFEENGVVKNRGLAYLNKQQMSDTGWSIGNAKWTVEGNKITFSTGKTFIVEDGCFNDYFEGRILRYYKENKEDE